jgi:hypothetical protein
MKIYCGIGGIAPAFLTLTLDGGEWSASCLGSHFTCWQRTSGTHWIGGWVVKFIIHDHLFFLRCRLNISQHGFCKPVSVLTNVCTSLNTTLMSTQGHTDYIYLYFDFNNIFIVVPHSFLHNLSNAVLFSGHVS